MALVVMEKAKVLVVGAVLFPEDIQDLVVGLQHGGVAHVERAMLAR
ncbi:hypothetical protein [uncultured Bacteroides sp.]|nr:hypothetical protein [uncultured Bacteroides sp.]